MKRRLSRRRRRSILEKDVGDENTCHKYGEEEKKHDDEDEDEDDHKEHDDDNKYAKYEQQQQRKSRRQAARVPSHAVGSWPAADYDFFRFPTHVFDAARHTVAISVTSSRVDACLASFGCAGSLALLKYVTLHTHTAYPVFGRFLVGSAVKFFFNENPPSLTAFIRSSCFAIVVGGVVHYGLPSYGGSSHYTREVLLCATLLYWKLYGGMWSAANSLSFMIAVESLPPAEEDPATAPSRFPWLFLFFPYLSGHVLLYVLARVLSRLRRKIRTYLIQREVLSHTVFPWNRHAAQYPVVGGHARQQRLRHLFTRMDTSGDGQLDAVELQVALRAATGTDISIADTYDIIQSVDSEGNGTLDFDAFCTYIDKVWPE